MKVYIVTSGAYSDYSLEGVFSTREKAEEFREQFNLVNPGYECANDVMEWEVDERAGETSRMSWSVVMELSNGEAVVEPYNNNPRPVLAQANLRNETPRLVRRFLGMGASRRLADTVDVVSYESLDHAVKVAAEFRQAWLREGGKNVD